MRGKIRIDGRKHTETVKGFPVIIYLTKDSKEKIILTGYHSKKEHWDKKNGLPNKKHPDFLSLLNYIEIKKIRLFKLIDSARSENISFSKAEDYLRGYESGVFYKDALNLELSRTQTTSLKSFNKFYPDYNYSEITKTTVVNYIDKLSKIKVNGKKRSANGIISYLNSLTAVWNKLDKPENPFSGVRPNAVKTKNKALADADMIKLQNNPFPKHDNSSGGGKHNYINYLLLCFYLGGIDLVDLRHLKRSNIINGRIEFVRNKGGTDVLVCNFIFPEAWEIINYYNEQDYLVPLYKFTKYNNFIPNMSRYFESMQKELGISKKPYSKAPRYTFITRAQNLLIDERIAIQLCGHSQSTTHSIYKDEFPHHVIDEAHKRIISFNM